jgi:UPF0716 protein FxsA
MGLLRVIGLLLLIPLFDMVLLVVVANWIGIVPSVALVVLTALVGMLLVRAEGRHTLRRIQTKLSQGSLPEDELVDGALLIAAGALLLTPGLVTDAVGLLLTLPPTRYPIRVAVKRYVVTPYVDAKTGGIYSGGVYTGGFPNPNANASDGGSTGETYDMDDDEYDVGRGSSSEN